MIEKYNFQSQTGRLISVEGRSFEEAKLVAEKKLAEIKSDDSSVQNTETPLQAPAMTFGEHQSVACEDALPLPSTA